MKLRNDLAQLEHVPFDAVPWVSSPEPGVERKMLERDGTEVARATSFVRYAPGSAFTPHVHARGEEFLVLEGTFEDEHGTYSAGTYVRNPPGSSHAPFSREGCVLFVKLRQFGERDLTRCVLRPDRAAFVHVGSVAVRSLHAHELERVSLIEVAENGTLALPAVEGSVEILVLSGTVGIGPLRCAPRTWIRAPGPVDPIRSENGASLWVKRGHFVAER